MKLISYLIFQRRNPGLDLQEHQLPARDVVLPSGLFRSFASRTIAIEAF